MGAKKGTGENAKHDFLFAGGKLLRRMGASWFVSYSCYVHIDHLHRNWSLVDCRARETWFNKTVPYHLYWLDKIGSMDDRRLARNKIGLVPAEVKKMAEKVLARFW